MESRRSLPNLDFNHCLERKHYSKIKKLYSWWKPRKFLLSEAHPTDVTFEEYMLGLHDRSFFLQDSPTASAAASPRGRRRTRSSSISRTGSSASSTSSPARRRRTLSSTEKKGASRSPGLSPKHSPKSMQEESEIIEASSPMAHRFCPMKPFRQDMEINIASSSGASTSHRMEDEIWSPSTLRRCLEKNMRQETEATAGSSGKSTPQRTEEDETLPVSKIKEEEDSPRSSGRSSPLKLIGTRVEEGYHKLKIGAKQLLCIPTTSQEEWSAAEKAIVFFFHYEKKQDYMKELDELSENYNQNDWLEYYEQVLSIAYDLESRTGSVTSVIWALNCIENLPEKIKDRDYRFAALIKLGLVWYNFTLELKYRYAVEDIKVTRTFYKCKESFEYIRDTFKLKRNDRDILNLLIDLIQAAFCIRCCEDTNQESELCLTRFVKMYGNKYNRTKLLHIPDLILALYFHEMASVEYAKGSHIAITYMEIAYYHMEDSKTNDLHKRYFLDVVLDLLRFNEQARDPYQNETLLTRIYNALKLKDNEEIENSYEYLRECAAISLAIWLQIDHDDKKFNAILNTNLRKSRKSGDDKFNVGALGAQWTNTIVFFAPRVYRHFADIDERKDTAQRILLGIYWSNKLLYGYKFAAITTYFFGSMAYKSNHYKLLFTFYNGIFRRVDEATAPREVQVYLMFSKLFKMGIYKRIKKSTECKKMLEETKDTDLLMPFFTEFVKYIHLTIDQNNCGRMRKEASEFVSKYGRNTIERAITGLAADYLFRKHYPSNKENTETIYLAGYGLC